MQPPVPVLASVTYPPGATNTQARITIDGVRGAIFEYAAGTSLGSLVSSWASTGGTDPFGNVYPAGFSAGSGSSFNGTDFVVNSNGEFFYSGTPALNNLVISHAIAAGTDAVGNLYLAGDTSYGVNTAGGYVASNMNAGIFSNWTTSAMNVAWTQTSQLPSVSADATSITTTSGNLTNVTKAWSIPGNDAQAGTVYRLTMYGNGVWATTTANTLMFALGAWGASITMGVPIGAAVMPLATGFDWVVTIIAQITNPATGAANVSIQGVLSPNSQNKLEAASLAFAAFVQTLSFTLGTTAPFRGQVQWGAFEAGQTITCDGSILERLGQVA